MIQCPLGINYCLYFKSLDAREVTPHLFCYEVAVGIGVADHKHRLLHESHPRRRASSGETTKETLAFARASSGSPREAVRPAIEPFHIRSKCSCIGRFNSICAKLAFSLESLPSGPPSLGFPTKISSALTGALLVGGNSGKSPNTRASDGHHFLSYGMSRTTRKAMNSPAGSGSNFVIPTPHCGSFPNPSMTSAIFSRVVICGKRRIAAETDSSSTRPLTIVAILLAV